MNNFKGSQGTWRYREQITHNGSFFRVECEKIDGKIEKVCNVVTRDLEKAEYNAKLLICAPELLEALQHTLEVLYLCDCPRHLQETYGNLFMNYTDLIQRATI